VSRTDTATECYVLIGLAASLDFASTAAAAAACEFVARLEALGAGLGGVAS